MNAEPLFRDQYIEVRALYAICFRRVPAISVIADIDVTAAFAFINKNLAGEVREVYQHAFYEQAENCMFFNSTIFVLKHKRLIGLTGNYCQVLHMPSQYDWALELAQKLAHFKLQVAPPDTPATIIGFARQATYN